MHSRPQCHPAGGWLRGTGGSGDENGHLCEPRYELLAVLHGTSSAGRFWVATGVTCDQAFFFFE